MLTIDHNLQVNCCFRTYLRTIIKLIVQQQYTILWMKTIKNTWSHGRRKKTQADDMTRPNHDTKTFIFFSFWFCCVLPFLGLCLSLLYGWFRSFYFLKLTFVVGMGYTQKNAHQINLKYHPVHTYTTKLIKFFVLNEMRHSNERCWLDVQSSFLWINGFFSVGLCFWLRNWFLLIDWMVSWGLKFEMYREKKGCGSKRKNRHSV